MTGIIGWRPARDGAPRTLASRRSEGDTEPVDDGRARLRDLGARLLELHTVLLAFERRAYEQSHGPADGGALLRLVIGHEHFAWLRALSAMIARLDEALDADPATVAVDVERFFREAHGLLRSAGDGAFARRYRDVLQRSPEAVMAHAEVMKVVPASRTARSSSQ